MTAIVVIIAMFIIINVVGWERINEMLGLSEGTGISSAAEGEVQVHFIDVGQGDCALILSESKSVLIDSGEAKYSKEIIKYINELEVESLDLIIVSHPHADHIGGVGEIIAEIGAERLIMPKIPDSLVPTTITFEKMLDAVEEHDVDISYAIAGDIIELDDAVLEIIAPLESREHSEFSGINDYSIITKLIHGGNSFLFTGDIEAEAEADAVRAGGISATVLKIPHHGSKSSSTAEFLSAVNADYVVISVATPNRYNHPHEDVLERLSERDCIILRTDEKGTIVFISNEEGLKVKS